MVNHSILDAACGSRFWDEDLLRRQFPDTTECFQKLVFTCLPCFVLWLFLPPWVYMLTKKKDLELKFGWLIISKTIVTALLIVNELVHLVSYLVSQLGKESSKPLLDELLSYHSMTSVVLIVSFGIALVLIHVDHRQGYISSGLLFTFWLILLIGLSMVLYSKVVTLKFNRRKVKLEQQDIQFFIQYLLSTINLVLSCFADTYMNKVDERTTPKDRVSILNRLSYYWTGVLILRGNKGDIKKADFWNLHQKEKSSLLSQQFEAFWNEKATKYMNSAKDAQKEKSVSKFSKNPGEAKTLLNHHSSSSSRRKEAKPSLFIAIFQVIGTRSLVAFFMKFSRELLSFAGPFILERIISFIKNPEQSIFIGLFYSFFIFFCFTLQTCMSQQSMDRILWVNGELKSALSSCIYSKSLRLKSTARKDLSIGQMVNLMAVNTNHVQEIGNVLINAVIFSTQICVCLIYLWFKLGPSALGGVAILLLMIPVNSFFMNRNKKMQVVRLKVQDNRLKVLNDILNGIKVIKFYAYELSFKLILDKIRNKELGYLRKLNILNGVSNLTWTLAPFLVSSFSFGIFLFSDKDNVLDVDTAFVSLALFNQLRHPLNNLPSTISNIIQCNVSMKRITDFLLAEEIEPADVGHEEIKDLSVLIRNANLGWDQNEPFLRNISFGVETKSSLAVIGPVGSGKSSLLSALLGEMHLFKNDDNDSREASQGQQSLEMTAQQRPLINTHGKIAYVAQQAWIMNATLRDNILFGNDFDADLYQRVVSACELLADIALLPAGDETEIGEKGINLSGGQKQRVSLARAVYSGADLYLFDDPLSAVDAHVGKSIFENVMGPRGMLRDKTRVIVTNSLSFLPQIDQIMLMDNGTIVEKGTFDELKANKDGPFNNFMRLYFESKSGQSANELEETKRSDKEVGQKKEAKVPLDDEEKNGGNSKKSVNDDTKGRKIIQKEKMEKGKVKRSVVLSYFRACNIYLIGLYLFLYALFNGVSAGSNFWLSKWTSNFKNEQSDKIFKFSVFVLLGFLTFLINLTADFLFIYVFTRAAKRLHSSMLFSILRCNMGFFDATPIGRIVNRFAKDIEATETKIPETFKTLIRYAANIISAIVVITINFPLFLVALVPLFAVYFFVQRYYTNCSRQVKRMDSVSRSPIFSLFGESLTGVSTIRAYSVQAEFNHKMQTLIDYNTTIHFAGCSANRWLGFRLEMIGTLVNFATVLFAVLRRNHISSGLAALSITYSLTINNQLSWIIRQLADFEANITSVERIREYCDDVPHEAPWTLDGPRADGLDLANWPSKGSLEFRDYSVKYRQELEPVLNHLNLSIRAGEKIGIVGRTGAGKSSLSLSLFRILDNYTEGTIAIDGVDIKTVGLHDLRKHLTIIPQDPVLFTGSLRMNLDPFGEFADQQLWQVLEQSNLKEFVQGLEKKLEFEITEGGDNLSVGQRQLICLARALLRKTKILLLDEATASVDHNTDELIQQTIRQSFSECTILTIAHRLNTIIDSDRILVLDQGRVAEFDKPSVLLANGDGFFRSMAAAAGLC